MPVHIPVSGGVAGTPVASPELGTPAGASDLSLIEGLQSTLLSTLAALIPPATRCAVLGFPSHGNVGDSAIWLGQQALLERLGATVTYTADARTFSRRELCRRLDRGTGLLDRGTVLLAGGGNLGDLWPGEQRFRENVLDAASGHRVIQLPQTIHFRDRTNLAHARSIIDRHPDVTLLVRDRRSLEIARNEFRAQSLLAPDLSLALGPLTRPAPPTESVVWLMRSDIEAAGARPPATSDWLEDVPSWLGAIHRRLGDQLGRRPGLRDTLAATLAAMYAPVARRRLARGCAMLGRGQTVVTDRLHGHLLSLLLGIPHVLLDNSYGKLRSFYETWTRPARTATWAHSVEEALAIAGRHHGR